MGKNRLVPFLFKIILIFEVLITVVLSYPIEEAKTDNEFAVEYKTLQQILVSDMGYSKDFANLVEINLKRAVKEERERQRQLALTPDLRQVNEDYEDEDISTTTGPTTPGVLPGDIVRGIAQLVTSVGTLNYKTFWQSFVNFFPPNQREGAQALVDGSLGRRPTKWPTIPTTTTKLTTTTKDEDELDSSEKSTTKAPVAVATAATSPSVPVTETKPAVMKYTLIRRRPGTSSPINEVLRVDDIYPAEIARITTTPSSAINY